MGNVAQPSCLAHLLSTTMLPTVLALAKNSAGATEWWRGEQQHFPLNTGIYCVGRGAWGVGRRRRRRYWALSQHPKMHGRSFAPLQVIRVWELATGIQSMTTLLESDWENARRAHWPRVRCAAMPMAPNSTRAGVGCSVGSLILASADPTGRRIADTGLWNALRSMGVLHPHTHARTPHWPTFASGPQHRSEPALLLLWRITSRSRPAGIRTAAEACVLAALARRQVGRPGHAGAGLQLRVWELGEPWPDPVRSVVRVAE